MKTSVRIFWPACAASSRMWSRAASRAVKQLQQSVIRKQPDLPIFRIQAGQDAGNGQPQLGMANPFYRGHEGTSGATALIGNRSYDNFASYDYLGLNGDERVQKAAARAIDRYGISASASGSWPESAPSMPNWNGRSPRITAPSRRVLRQRLSHQCRGHRLSDGAEGSRHP